MSESSKITLVSSDGEHFDVDEAVAGEFEVIAHMMEDGCAGKPIPIANVRAMVLAKAIEYCKKHVEVRAVEGSEEAEKANLKEWDDVFMNSFDMKGLLTLVIAANYLNIKGLLDLLCQKIADGIKDYKVEEVRTLFNIENDYTEEEEAALRKENEWAFHDE